MLNHGREGFSCYRVVGDLVLQLERKKARTR